MDTFLELFSKYNTAINACLIGLDQLIVDVNSGKIERSIKYGSACYLLNEKMFVLVEKNTEKPYLLSQKVIYWNIQN